MIEFIFWFTFMVYSFFIILYSFIHFSNKKEVLNNFVGFSALFLTFLIIIIVVSLMFLDRTLYSETIPIFTRSFGLPLLIIGALILISSVFLFLYKRKFKNKDLSKFWIVLEEKTNNRSKLRGDIYRKIPHILIFLGLLLIWYLGVIFVKDLSGSISGMIPEDNNMFLVFLTIMTEPKSIRKAKRLGFPFNFLCYVLLCEEEKRGYGTYLFFAIGQMVAALITPPMVFLTILGMSSLADLATSQVGIRYGKNKIKWNNEKSWQGAIAGIIACFIICTLFIGIYWALIFSIAFFIFDIFTNKPFNISDNLLIPFGSSLIFLFIRFFFNFEYFTIILNWI